MNSMSGHYYKDDCEPCKKEKKEKKCCPVVLKCNCGSYGPAILQIPEETQFVLVNQPIASVTVDTSCLCNPTIKVDFCGTLTAIYEDFDETVTYNFTLYRTCRGNGSRQALKSFSVSQLFADDDLPDSRGLCFSYSECDNECFDCCTYTLELTSVSATDDDESLNLSITGTLCVLAVSSCC